MTNALSHHLAEGVRRLREAGLSGAEKDAARLMAHVVRPAPSGLGAHTDVELSDMQVVRFFQAIEQRSQRLPVAQIVGRRDFWAHAFHVTGDVLDPRPDTETLVELALERDFARVLDLGVGSGCILLSLLAARPDATGVGVDASVEALRVAEFNRQELNLAERAELCISDWFKAVEGTFDLIVSNPPYVDAQAYETLAEDVRKYEPRMALTPGDTGLEAYQVIVPQASAHLASGGGLMVEIGFDQGAAVRDIFTSAGYSDVTIHKDLNGRDRVVAATRR